MELATLSISLVAVAIAVWQGYLSKAQLVQAKTTKSETEKLLAEIQSKVLRIEAISDETRKDVKEQISKLIDKQDENFKVLLNAPKIQSQNEIIKSMLPRFLENPEMLKAAMELSKSKQENNP